MELELAQLLANRHKFVCFNVTSRAEDIDCESSLCHLAEDSNVYPRASNPT